jgi:hypothetical protein
LARKTALLPLRVEAVFDLLRFVGFGEFRHGKFLDGKGNFLVPRKAEAYYFMVRGPLKIERSGAFIYR